jgi:hypothetical protein
MKNFWFQVIDAFGAQYCDGTFCPINWREETRLEPKSRNYIRPETWKSEFPIKMFEDICKAESGTSGNFNDRFSWIKE